MKKIDKIFLLCFFLILSTCFLRYFVLGADNKKIVKIETDIFPSEINGWHSTDLVMEASALNLIQPDMFLFRNYTRENKNINVFIGYYETLDKSDLAHSPLICYPGSGWTIEEKRTIKLNIKGDDIGFTQLKLKKGSRRDLVLFGYKTKGLMTGDLIRARINLIKNNFFNGRDNSAFRRSIL